MKKKYHLRKLKAKKSYSTQELSRVLRVHPQTVRGWKKNGLKSIDGSSHASLYLGFAVKDYLRAKMESRKTKLKPDEFYCMTCQDRTTSIKTTFTLQNKLIGKSTQSIQREGLCVKCGKKVSRFDSNKANDLDTTKVISPNPEFIPGVVGPQHLTLEDRRTLWNERSKRVIIP